MLDAVRWSARNAPETLPGKLRLIDQTRLPGELTYIETDNAAEIHDAIKRLVVRGAPAIGCAAALGLAAICQHYDGNDPDHFINHVHKTAEYLATSRPTAVNLFWALGRCQQKLDRLRLEGTDNVDDLKRALLSEALAILHEDIELCKTIGEKGVHLFKGQSNCGILTHCNAGALATSDYGTALSPIYVAKQQGLRPRVFADETRPLLQGARLTTWELMRAGVDVTLICDNMAAVVMQQGKIDMVIVGADRIAANGDAANKIGTYGVAVLADYHNIPFYVAAPSSTLDHDLATGDQIPIEQRSATEITHGFGRQTAPDGCQVYSPAFDITPAALISGIITERGILTPPYAAAIAPFK